VVGISISFVIFSLVFIAVGFLSHVILVFVLVRGDGSSLALNPHPVDPPFCPLRITFCSLGEDRLSPAASVVA